MESADTGTKRRLSFALWLDALAFVIMVIATMVNFTVDWGGVSAYVTLIAALLFAVGTVAIALRLRDAF